VVVDRLTKYAHFILLSHPYTVQKIADIFMENIVKLHGPPASIVSDRDIIFTSSLWKEIFSAFQTKLNFNPMDKLSVSTNVWSSIFDAWPSRSPKNGVTGYLLRSGGITALTICPSICHHSKLCTNTNLL
jgi:hypothetical protein